MNKKLISWEVFRAAMERQEAWLSRSWLAFTNEGIVVITGDTESEETAQQTFQGL